MKRALRIFGWVVVALILLLGVAALAAHLLADRKRNRVVDIKVSPVAYVDDQAAIDRGRYLFYSRGCGDCHGENGAGKLLIDAPNGLRVWTPNLTSGAGSAVAKYSEADWVRAIRHGVKPDGRPMLIMPSEDYNRLTDADLAALVAFTRRLPAVAGESARFELPLTIRALYVGGLIPDAPEKIDHSLPPQQPVQEGVNARHGAYVANMCKGCHGIQLTGGKIPGAPPEWPPAPDLTSPAIYGVYDSPDKFRQMMRTGQRPGGSRVEVMPFGALKQFNDTDLDALYLYLSALPTSAGTR